MSAIASRSAGSCSPADAEKPCSLNHLTIVIPRCSASSVTVLTWLVSSWLPVLTRTNPAPRLTGMILPGCCRTSAHYPMSYDPLVLVHARALLTSAPGGMTSYIEADVRDTEEILGEAGRTLDFGQPIALMMLGIMGQLPDSARPRSIVTTLLAALPPGSYLALSDGTDTSPALNQAIAAYNQNSASSYHLRSPEEIARFFDGLTLVPPGVVTTSRWRPDLADASAEPREVDAICGVGRKD